MMPNLTIFFAHGRESGPWGTKIRAMTKVAEAYGCRVVSLDDSDNRDPELRASRLVEEVKATSGPVVLVGSSMGGYVATVASQSVQPLGLFLMAPAFGLPGYAHLSPHAVTEELTVVHGWNDDLIPIDSVLAFARSHQALLHMVPAGHALLEQLDYLTHIFDLFLQRCLQISTGVAKKYLVATI